MKSLESNNVEKLSQERLEALWKELADSASDDEKLRELVSDKEVVLKNNNLFNIKVSNLFFESQFRPYQMRILSFLREKTGNEALQYKIVVEVEQKEARAYMPREKFEELANINPAIYKLRKLFPDIDF